MATKKTGNLNKTVSFRLTESEGKTLEKLISKLGTTKSHFLRDWIHRFHQSPTLHNHLNI